jgi:hypothetical protein
MLKLTKELVAGYESLGFRDRHAKLKLIARHGSLTDAQELLGLYLVNPDFGELLQPIRKLGDSEIGAELFRRCFDRKDQGPCEIVELSHTIGYLGCQEALLRLWEKASKGDYFDCQGAAQGLVNLDCTSIRNEIADEIRKLKGKSLFNEFLPLLAYKTEDERFIEEMFLWGDGNTYGMKACEDCNGGLIAGIALFGDKGKTRFEEILWSQNWEAADRATGSCLWTYHGVRLFNYRFSDLLQQIKCHEGNGSDEQLLSYEVSVLLQLIDIHISSSESVSFKFTPEPLDSWRDLEQLCDSDDEGQTANHGWGNSLHDFIAKHFETSQELIRQVYGLRDLLELRAEQEVEREMLKRGGDFAQA